MWMWTILTSHLIDRTLAELAIPSPKVKLD